MSKQKGRVITTSNQNNPIELMIDVQVAGLKEPMVKIESIFKKTKKSGLAKQLEILDNRRESAFVCISKISDGYLNHFDEK